MKFNSFAKSLIAVAVLASGAAHAGFYDDNTASNTLSGAVNVDPYFTATFNPDVGDVNGLNTSTSLPWVSIWGQGDGAYDYYSFSSGGGTIIADIDYTYQNQANRHGFDSEIAIWRANGDGTFALLAQNDDHAIIAGDGGTIHAYDAFIQLDNAASGRYVVGVATYSSTATSTGFTGTVIGNDRQYGLAISTAPVPEPETYAMLLAGLGVMGAIARRRNNKAA